VRGTHQSKHNKADSPCKGTDNNSNRRSRGHRNLTFYTPLLPETILEAAPIPGTASTFGTTEMAYFFFFSSFFFSSPFTSTLVAFIV